MSRGARYWRWWLIGYVALCMIVDLFPHYGPPNFRYSGADPELRVWNFGWPLSSAIYDSRSGLHAGPMVDLVILMQLSCLGIGAGAFAVARKMRRLAERLLLIVE